MLAILGLGVPKAQELDWQTQRLITPNPKS
jgi:hypothetical protein